MNRLHPRLVVLLSGALALSGCAGAGLRLPPTGGQASTSAVSASATPASAAATTSGATPSTSGCHMHGADPDPSCTPGALNAAVTQATIHRTICGVAGYTSTIRPPVGESNRLKHQAALAYGLTIGLNAVEGDHLISLELGGAPDDIRNFWDEPHVLANPPDGGSLRKDGYENYLNRQVCSGATTLAAAQHAIASDWYGAWVAAGRPSR